MKGDELPPHKRAIWDKIYQICDLLDRKGHKGPEDEGYERLMRLLEKFIIDLQAEGYNGRRPADERRRRVRLRYPAASLGPKSGHFEVERRG